FNTIRQCLESGIRPRPVSVNVSGTEVLAFDVPAFFKDMLEKYRIPPVYFEIEINQSTYVRHGRIILEAEAALRANGFKVIMDSFDGDFLAISSVGANPDAYKLSVGRQKESIAQVFNQARAQHVELRANRIESMEQLMELRRAGCNEGQGYVLHEPLAVEDFLEVSRRSKSGKASHAQPAKEN
ncbi:MAG: EAL domain-containing protein, partial [Clostridia bacterium]|nr:EAL domain-containing protein [Clostridia bacterium]